MFDDFQTSKQTEPRRPSCECVWRTLIMHWQTPIQ